MRRLRPITMLIVILAAAASVQAAEEQWSRLDRDRFLADLAALTAAPHRLAGTPEGRRAGDYIRSEFEKLPGRTMVQRFAFPQQIVKRCEIRLGDRTLPLVPLHANGMQPSVTNPEGLTAPVIYVGGATEAELSGHRINGAIIVADFGANHALVRVFRHNARAIIFVGTGDETQECLAGKRSWISVDIPRFYVSAADAEAAGLKTAESGTLISQVDWERRVGRNIYLWLEGSRPTFTENGAPEFLVLSVPYDSAGIVPWRSPGRTTAANCAALLETARTLSRRPPRRNVLIAFLDNHANFLEGGRQFYTAWRRSIPGTAPTGENEDRSILQQRLAYVDQEEQHLKKLLAYLAVGDIYAPADEFVGEDQEPLPRNEGLDLLREEAKFRYNEYQERLTTLRLEKDRLERRDEPVEAIDEQIEELLAEQRKWQWVRESLRDEKPVKTEAEQTLQKARRNVTTRIENRLAELDGLRAFLQDALTVTEPFRTQTPTGHIAYCFTPDFTRWLFIPHGGTHEKLQATLLDRVSDALDAEARLRSGFVWESKTVLQSKVFSPLSYVSYPVNEASQFAEAFEIPAMTLVTGQAKAPFLRMPHDGYTQEDFDRVRRQAEGFLSFLWQLSGAEWASVPNRILKSRRVYIDDYVWEDGKISGHFVKSFSFGETAPNRLEPNALVHVIGRSSPHNDYYMLADGNASFPLYSIIPEWSRVMIEAARFDDDGRISDITASIPTGSRGSVQSGWTKASHYGMHAQFRHHVILAMFRGESGRLLGRTLPFGDLFSEKNFKLMNGLSNSDYKRAHWRYDPVAGCGVYYVANAMGVKFIYEDSRNADDVALYINGTAESAAGRGYGPGSPQAADGPPYTIDLETGLASDMFRLNEYRLNTLRRKNIILNFLEYLHSQSDYLLEQYREAVSEQRHQLATNLAVQAAALERRIYRPVKATINDMVKAVTFLLLLAIPFAFSLQSLVLPTYSVYRKIAYFAVLFLLAFVILYFVHPAFQFASLPIIIILAFIIVVMSAMVIWIIGDKFVYEIKKMQGLAKAAHSFQSNWFGNIGAAMSLAISTMRRRPIRTLLTVITVLLLTFTILSFVSFQTEKGVNRFYIGPGDQTSRMLLRRKVWKSLTPTVMEEVAAYLGEGFHVHGRYWKARELTTDMVFEDLYIPIRRKGGGSAVAGVMMTMHEHELDHIPGFKRFLPGDIETFNAGGGAFLPDSIAKELGVRPGDTLLVQGEELTFLGVFDSQELLKLHQLDGSPLLPVNFSITKLSIGEFESKGSAAGSHDPLADLEAELAQLEPEALRPVTPDGVIVVSARAQRRLGMSLKAILIYPREGEDLERVAENLAILFDDGVYLNQGGERTFHLYSERLGETGAADVAIPLLLGGLIVFSTMLGSIIDREREIYTFSALGLGPKNIAMLFFVEAGIYAVIGGFGGYMFSQIVTRMLEWLATYGIFKAPEMNYSSSTAIYTILLVMVTVVISTIYPAVKAARKATADTASAWRVPPPKGDVCAFDFPFTISQYDITGITCFIREHFAGHADRTIGKFAADQIELFREAEFGMAGMRARVWLQPFDQGISQQFTLTARPSEIEEVCEIHVRCERLSGPPSAWKRSNTVFLRDLRLQFLLWRTLEEEAMDHYLILAEEVERQLDIDIEEIVQSNAATEQQSTDNAS